MAQAICGWMRVGRSRASDDVFPADDFSERDDAIGHHFRVLDEIGGVADNRIFPAESFTSRETLNSVKKSLPIPLMN